MKQFLLCDKPCFPSGHVCMCILEGVEFIRFRDLLLVAEAEKSTPMAPQSLWLPASLI